MTTTIAAAPACPAPYVQLPLLTKLHALRNFHTGTETVRDAAGPVALVTVGPGALVPTIAVVTSPQGARDVLGGTDAGIDKGGIAYTEMRRWMGRSLFTLANEPWKARRRLLQPLFTKKHVAEFAGHMAGAAEELAGGWGAERTIDVDAEMRILTTRVLGRSLFGTDLAQVTELIRSIRITQYYMSRRVTSPVRVPAWVPTPAQARFAHHWGALETVVDEAVTECLADPERDAELIRLLHQIRDPDTGRPLPAEDIRRELMVFMIAGHDTTSTALAYAMWALGRHPEVQARVHAEVSALGNRPLTVDDVRSLPYTVQVLHEALRLCPPVPAVSRAAARDVVIDGYAVPKGTTVVVSAWALHHDPALWDDPQRFDPDRFATDRARGRDRWQYLPFGAGPRSCIGDHFAMLEATLGLASVVRAVEVESLHAEFPMAVPFTLVAAGPIAVRVSRRHSLRGDT